MTTFLTLLLVLACLIVLTCVLLQPAKGGAAFGTGSSQSLFGSGGATSFLFKLTMWGAAFIMATCLALAILHAKQNRSSVIDLAPSAEVPPVTGAPVATEVPPTAPATK